MPTLIFGTGFEHQVAALGASHATGEALWDSVPGSPTISTSTKRTGVASLRINPAAFLQGLTRNIPAGNRRLVAVVHVNFAAFPPSFDAFILVVQSGAVVVKIGIRAGTNKWFAQVGSGTAQVSSSGPSLGTWYRVECRLDTSAEPWNLDWCIDGVAETQATLATAADDIGTISFGHATGTTTTRYHVPSEGPEELTCAVPEPTCANHLFVPARMPIFTTTAPDCTTKIKASKLGGNAAKLTCTTATRRLFPAGILRVRP